MTLSDLYPTFQGYHNNLQWPLTSISRSRSSYAIDVLGAQMTSDLLAIAKFLVVIYRTVWIHLATACIVKEIDNVPGCLY